MRRGLLVFAVVVLAGCAVPGDPAAPPAPGDPGVVIDELRGSRELRDAIQFHRDVSELLSNTTFQYADYPAAPMTAAVVVGRVVGVQRGAGFHVPGDDAPSGTLIDYDDPRVEWRTVHVEVAVSRIVSGAAADRVTVGFSFDPDLGFERLAGSFRGMGELLLFRSADSPVYDYDPSVYAVVDDGTMLAYVDPEGRLGLPALRPEDAAVMLRRTPTLDALVAAADEPARLIRIDGSGVRLDG